MTYDWNKDGSLDATEYGRFERMLDYVNWARWNRMKIFDIFIQASIQYLFISLCLSIYLLLCLIYLYFIVSFFQFLSNSVYLCNSLSICLFACMHVCPSICMHVCLSICL